MVLAGHFASCCYSLHSLRLAELAIRMQLVRKRSLVQIDEHLKWEDKSKVIKTYFFIDLTI